MNRFITYSARAKLGALQKNSPGSVATKITAGRRGGIEIMAQFSSRREHDIIICNSPFILTDLFTLTQLESASIDFSYPSEEFIITRRADVLPTPA